MHSNNGASDVWIKMKDILRSITLLFLVLNLVTANMLECRIVTSYCQEDPTCLAEMQARFPICFTEQLYNKRSWENGGTDKRAIKLMNILLRVDRIPVGR
ncbi:hypothetical protein M3Y97_00033700 [Aphelenchoides bicaudatus]|nr:hypothetical protein M3Y97_00033700 [Aphelenchoides bicaudatus]